MERDVARARRTEQPLVLAFLDVDQLKAVNDSRGHAAGDRMLLEVAQTVRAALRPYDLIIRYGGDEFICAISGLDMAGVSKRLALVNTVLANAPEHGSISAGIALLQSDESAADLVARADTALYRERQHMNVGASSASPQPNGSGGGEPRRRGNKGATTPPPASAGVGICSRPPSKGSGDC